MDYLEACELCECIKINLPEYMTAKVVMVEVVAWGIQISDLDPRGDVFAWIIKSPAEWAKLRLGELKDRR